MNCHHFTMSNEEDTPTNPIQPARVPRGMNLEETHAMRHYNVILALQQSVRQIRRQLEQLTTQFLAFQRGQRPQEPSDDGDEQSFSSDSSMGSNPRRGGRRPPMDEFRDIKVEPLEFNGNLNPDEYLEWVQVLDRIFKAKGYDCLLYTSPSPRDGLLSRMPSSA